MDDSTNVTKVTAEVHSNLKSVVITIGFLVICVLALTYGEYNMGKALNKAFTERQMLLDRIEVLEKNVSELASQNITTDIDVGEVASSVDDVDDDNVAAAIEAARSVVGSAVGAAVDAVGVIDKTVE